MLMPPQEYLVSGIDEVKAYIDKNIGIDYEITRDSDDKGSIVVFEIEYQEHKDLRQYITDGDLWLE